MMRELLPTEADAFFEAMERNPSIAVRPNPLKNHKAVAGQPVPWSSLGYRMTERPAFTFDPLFHAGCYYVQEPSTLFVEQALATISSLAPKRSAPLCLDLCAAPGGKTTLLRSLIPDDALLIANEPMSQRVQVLCENVWKWGHPLTAVTQSYAEDFERLGPVFDLILVDAPCSGEGMMRKEEKAVTQWSPSLIEQCSRQQRTIVSHIWRALKPGGFLIYSTCTYNLEEDENNVAYFRDQLGAEIRPIPIKAEWNLLGSLTSDTRLPVYRFLPHRTDSEGFFLALLRKPEEAQSPQRNIGKKKKRQRQPNNAQLSALNPQLKSWLLPGDYVSLSLGNTLYAIPASVAPTVDRLLHTVRIVSAGVPLAEQKGNRLRPVHPLALSSQFRRAAFPSVTLTYPEALAYLRREALTLPAQTPGGHVLVTFLDVPLGFVNNLGTRANNLYPPSWSIRSAHTPDSYRPVVE